MFLGMEANRISSESPINQNAGESPLIQTSISDEKELCQRLLGQVIEYD